MEFQERIKRSSDQFIESQKRAQAELPRRKIELHKLEVEAKNLGSAIAEYGIRRSPTLIAQLTFVENRIEVIEGHLKEIQPELPKVSTERVREFVLQRASELETILLGDRAAAKQALRTSGHWCLHQRKHLMVRSLPSRGIWTFFLGCLM